MKISWAMALIVSAGLHALVLAVLVATNSDASKPTEPAKDAAAETTEAAHPSDADGKTASPSAATSAKSEEALAAEARGADEAPTPSTQKPTDKGAGSPSKTSGQRTKPKDKPKAETAKNTAKENMGSATRQPSPSTSATQAEDDGNASSAASACETYVVKSGDNLSKIAKKHGIAIQLLATLNGTTVKKLSNLKVGQKIKVPKDDAAW